MSKNVRCTSNECPRMDMYRSSSVRPAVNRDLNSHLSIFLILPPPYYYFFFVPKGGVKEQGDPKAGITTLSSSYHRNQNIIPIIIK